MVIMFIDALCHRLRKNLLTTLSTTLIFTAAIIAHAQSSANTTLLVDIDHRPATSLDGDWHTIVDPYATGLYSSHHELKANGYFMNAKQ